MQAPRSRRVGLLAALAVCGAALSGCAGNQPPAYKAGYDTVTVGNSLMNKGVTACDELYAAYGKEMNRSEWIQGCQAAEVAQNE